jgi:hypothetical protein
MQVAYRGHMPDEFLDSLDAEKRTNMWRELTQNPDKMVFVAEDSENNVVGFSALGPSRDPDADPNTAEVSAIYVHPEKWERALVAHCCPHHSMKFESPSLTKLRCGYWKQTNEHGYFMSPSDL